MRLLEPVDQVERLGAVADGQGEHLEAGLAALKRIAALVCQPGDHLPMAASRSAWRARSWACLRKVMSGRP